eukprot:m.28060 g.28060  ORF g.28060 m.28060 type:complete len:347 (+) comp7969_c0_seq1:30-1070(+)
MMAETQEKQQGLREHYEEGVKLHTELKSMSTSTEGYEEKRLKALHHFKKSSELVRELSVFSSNEEYSEHSAASLKYVLTSAYTADLITMTKVITDDPERNQRRLRTLENAKTYKVEFLELCISLSIRDAKSLAKYIEMKPGARLDRDVKLATMKGTKAAETTLKELTDKMASVKSHEIDDDEDIGREHVLAMINLWIYKICNLLEICMREVDMLTHIVSKEAEKPQSPSQSQRSQEAERTPSKPITLTKADIERMSRTGESINRADFKLINRGYGPIGAPTMTLDEFADQEMLKAAEASARQAQEPVEDENDDSDAKADAATYKARAWDEFKDNVRRGDGNRYNMG